MYWQGTLRTIESVYVLEAVIKINRGQRLAMSEAPIHSGVKEEAGSPPWQSIPHASKPAPYCIDFNLHHPTIYWNLFQQGMEQTIAELWYQLEEQQRRNGDSGPTHCLAFRSLRYICLKRSELRRLRPSRLSARRPTTRWSDFTASAYPFEAWGNPILVSTSSSLLTKGIICHIWRC